MSIPSTAPFTRCVMKSMLSSGPPRLRFQPRSSPPHLPASMIRSRRKAMLAWRWATDTPAARRSGYFAPMHLMMELPSFEAHDPPLPPPGTGLGVGLGAGAAGVRKPCVTLQELEFSPSPARARQKCDVPELSGELAKVVSAAPS